MISRNFLFLPVFIYFLGGTTAAYSQDTSALSSDDVYIVSKIISENYRKIACTKDILKETNSQEVNEFVEYLLKEYTSQLEKLFVIMQNNNWNIDATADYETQFPEDERNLQKECSPCSLDEIIGSIRASLVYSVEYLKEYPTQSESLSEYIVERNNWMKALVDQAILLKNN